MIYNNPWKLLSFTPTTTTFTIMGTISNPPSFTSNPLFSSIVTLYILIILYFPQIIPKLVISPLLISTLVLLLSLLRLGVSQRIQQQQQPNVDPLEPKAEVIDTFQHVQTRNDPNDLETQPGPEPKLKPNTHTYDSIELEIDPGQEETEDETQPSNEFSPRPEPEELDVTANHDEEAKELATRQPETKPDPFADPKHSLGENLVEWNLWGPLEVIYEAYEGEESEEERQDDAFPEDHNISNKNAGIKRYPSLSRYYPESDTDTDTDTDTDSSCSYLDEDEKDGLIEIALDYNYGYVNKGLMTKLTTKEVEVDDDQDGLIEIDISPTRVNSDFSWYD